MGIYDACPECGQSDNCGDCNHAIEQPLYCGLCQRLWVACEKNICSTRKFFNWYLKALTEGRIHV